MIDKKWAINHDIDIVENKLLDLDDEHLRNRNINNTFKNNIIYNKDFSTPSFDNVFRLGNTLFNDEIYRDIIETDYLKHFDYKIETIEILLTLINILMLSRLNDYQYGRYFIQFLLSCNILLHSYIPNIIRDPTEIKCSVNKYCILCCVINKFKDFHILLKHIIENNTNNFDYVNSCCIVVEENYHDYCFIFDTNIRNDNCRQYLFHNYDPNDTDTIYSLDNITY